MRTLLALVLLETVLGTVASGADDAQELTQRDVRLLDVSGTPYQRGLAHGRALKAEIRELLGDFKKDLHSTYRVDAKTFIAQFLSETNFMPAIEKWTPGLLDEIRGIAKGAELPFEEVYVFQMADEIWSMGEWAMREKCTAIAVNRRGAQPTLVAQNMDIPGFYQKFPMVLRVREENGPDKLVFTCPGLIGVNGMNSASVAVCCNTLLQLRPSRNGLPCLFVVRGVLAQKDLAAAEAWLNGVPHAVGQNYTLGDPNEARSFECSAGAKIRFRPDPQGDFTYHTNHPLVNTDWHPNFVSRCAKSGQTPAEGMGACLRFEALKKRVRVDQPIGVDTIKSALASRDHPFGPICGDWTYGCTIFVLKDRPQLLLAPGRPDRYSFQVFEF